MQLPQSIQAVIDEFSKLPGVGRKSAERIAFYLLRASKASRERLGQALSNLKQSLFYCRTCQMIAENEECSVCTDLTRNASEIMVTESPLDVLAFEKTDYKGRYHVLHGVLSPIDGFGPEQLKMKELIDRCNAGGITEVIIATNPDVEGEATAAYIKNQLVGVVPSVTRLAHGLPMGADIEFADQVTLKESLVGRRAL